MMLRNVVVLPAPFRPTRQTSSPAATDKLMPFRMRLDSISTFTFARLSITGAFSTFEGGFPPPRRSSPGRRRTPAVAYPPARRLLAAQRYDGNSARQDPCRARPERWPGPRRLLPQPREPP